MHAYIDKQKLKRTKLDAMRNGKTMQNPANFQDPVLDSDMGCRANLHAEAAIALENKLGSQYYLHNLHVVWHGHMTT